LFWPTSGVIEMLAEKLKWIGNEQYFKRHPTTKYCSNI
jgi:hypothetical protein